MIDLYWLFQVEMSELGRDRDADYDSSVAFEEWLYDRFQDDNIVAEKLEERG
jgi:hypothetical protein